MSRIRTIKPEWLEDERLAEASDAARVLSVALIVLSDDYGNGRASARFLGPRVFPMHPEALGPALEELESIEFVTRYTVAGQSYYSIRTWNKHQRLDKRGTSPIPAPHSNPTPPSRILPDSPGDSRIPPASCARADLDLEGKGPGRDLEGSAEGAAPQSPPAPKPKGSSRGTRIPDDFGVTPELEDFCVREGLPDPHAEMPKLIAHFRTAPGAKGVKLEWPLVAQVWMRNARDKHGAPPWSSGSAYLAAKVRSAPPKPPEPPRDLVVVDPDEIEAQLALLTTNLTLSEAS